MSATSGMGGGKSANVDLNLVPFIDLFSTLVCFLLMTAAWQELDVMQNATPPKAASEVPPDQTQPPPPDDKKKVVLTVAVSLDKTQVSENDQIQTFPNQGDAPDIDRVVSALRVWKEKYPDRRDVILATDSKAKYKYLIQMMDTLIEQKFPDVSVNLN